MDFHTKYMPFAPPCHPKQQLFFSICPTASSTSTQRSGKEGQEKPTDKRDTS